MRSERTVLRMVAGALGAVVVLAMANVPAEAGCVGAALPSGGGGLPLQGTYVTPFQDANKSGPWPHDTDPVTGDSNLCWAATAANMLAQAGWGVGVGQDNAQALFTDQLNPLYPNRAGATSAAIADYFALYHPTVDRADYADFVARPQGSTIDALLADGSSLGLYLPYTTETGAHALSIYGTVQDPRTFAYTGVILADNEDNATQLASFAVVERIIGGTVPVLNMPGYWGQPDIAAADVLETRNPTTTLNQVWTGTVPPISDALAAYLQDFYVQHPDQTGITDAPVTGFDGRVLTAADTGFDGLRYQPGPAVGDQTPGNGIDELVLFSFYMPQIADRHVISAELHLNLTPKDSLVSTDLLLFADTGSLGTENFGNEFLKRLEPDVRTTIRLPIEAMPSSQGLRDLRWVLGDGTLDVIYGDDALIHWAALSVTLANAVPEPGTLALLSVSLAALAMAGGGRRAKAAA